jgi:hypothetical protein
MTTTSCFVSKTIKPVDEKISFNDAFGYSAEYLLKCKGCFEKEKSGYGDYSE